MHATVPPEFEIVIVGGGLAGSVLATLLGRAGRQVAVIDMHDVYPPDFRAEQLVGEQCGQLAQLGLLQDAVGPLPPIPRSVAAAGGKLIGQVEAPHYGFAYETLVARLRAAIPRTVRWLTGRVVDIATGIDTQAITLAGGQTLTARLVILASG
ncbi:MAG: FAD-dependent monooxygenase, partial [Rhodospirillales bacterium]|nr:FAD-dependent monooxygenase [Rhodospirillales bacterium]